MSDVSLSVRNGGEFNKFCVKDKTISYVIIKAKSVIVQCKYLEGIIITILFADLYYGEDS